MTTDRTALEFNQCRTRLFGLAYRLLGSAAEAEEVIQDAYIRLYQADRAAIESLPAWLAKVVTNLCLNRLTSLTRQREQYIGPWLPEPVLTQDGALGPMETAEQRDSVSFALLVLLERLSPSERAVFVLRQAFAYSYRDVAQVLDMTEANCRQVFLRAKARVGEGRHRFEPNQRRQADLVELFLSAARDGDLHALERFLADDVVAWSDGGGKATAGRRPVRGAVKVARLAAGMFAKFTDGLTISLAQVNGTPTVIGVAGSTLLGVWVIEVTDNRISALHAVSNPDKLAFLAGQLSHSGGVAGSF